MATADQYADWIVRNKDKKGTPEFETVAEAYRLVKQQAAAPAEPAGEIPTRRAGPSLADIGDRATGFRPQVEATGMTPEERMGAVRTGAQILGGLAAGPIIGGLVRGAGAAIPALQRVAQPVATAIESGGFRSGLSATAPKAAQAAMRVAGGATAGAAGATVAGGPEEAATGAIIGAAVPVAGRLAGRLIAPKGPSTMDVRKAATEAYGEAERLGGEVSPEKFTTLTYRIANKLDEGRFNPVLHPKVQRAVDTLTAEATQAMPVSLNRLDTLRRVAARAGASSSADEQRLGKIAVDEIDTFIRESMPEASVAALEKARDLWAKMSRSKQIEGLITKASRSTKEPSAALRRQFQLLADNERKLKTFTADEQALIKRIADGSMSVSALETIGTFAPPRIGELRKLPGLVGAAGYGGIYTVSPPAAIALGGTGYASRAIANQLARAQAQQLAMQARTGAPAAQTFAPGMFPQVLPALGANALASEPDNALAR